jgi:LETM1 and EF-hand domain-containing protein 1
MRRSLGLVRQGCSARPLATRLSQASQSRSHLYSPAASQLHTSAFTSYPSTTQSVRSNHNLNPATTSSTNNDNHPLPLPPKKRASGSRLGSPTQTRSTPSKENSRPAPIVDEALRIKAATSAASASRDTAQVAADQLAKAKATESTSKSTSASATTSASTSQSPKKPEPPKTLLDRIKGLWENLKYLFRFYYEGVKQIWRDRKIVADLRKKITDRQAQSGEGTRFIEDAMIKQHEADLRKLPLFLAILLILEEVLPLVVIYAPSLLPSTCVLPSQSTKMRSEEERLRGLAVQALSSNDAVRKAVTEIAVAAETQPRSYNSSEGDSATTSSATPLDPVTIKKVAQLFGLSARGPSSMVQSRIQRHLGKLKTEDELLQRALHSKSSTPEWKEICRSDWLWKACAQRGLRSFEAEERVMEHNLIAYLHLTTSQTLDDTHRSLLPLALYDGTLQDLMRYQREAEQESSKGIRRRTQEVVQEVKETEKKKKESH